MIAPDPALTGRLPAATTRPAAEPDDAPRARGGEADFDAVLAGVCKRVGKEGRAVVAKGGADEAADGGAAEVAAAGPQPEAVPALPDLPIAPVLPGGPVTAEPVDASVALASAIPEVAAAVVAEIAAAMPVATPAPAAASGDKGGEAVPAAAVVAPPAAPPAPVAAPRPAPLRAAGAPPERKDVREAEEVPREAAPVARHLVAAPSGMVALASASPPPVTASAVVGAAELVVVQDRAPVGWQLTAGPVAQASVGDEARTLSQPAGVTPQAVIAQVAIAVGKAADRRVQIRLDPPELGRVQIHLTPVDGGVQAVVLADRPETQDLLRRHADGLARELGAAGYGSVSLDFAAGHEAAPDRDERPAPERPQAGLLAAAVEAAPAAPGRRSLAGGLDVRL